MGVQGDDVLVHTTGWIFFEMRCGCWFVIPVATMHWSIEVKLGS